MLTFFCVEASKRTVQSFLYGGYKQVVVTLQMACRATMSQIVGGEGGEMGYEELVDVEQGLGKCPFTSSCSSYNSKLPIRS